MTLLQDLIDDQLRLLGPPVDRVAPGTNGYGVDLVCVLDVTADMAEVDPQSAAAVTQAIMRRLVTPRGALLDDRSYGFDLRSYCNKGTTQAELMQLQAQVRSEARKDDRVATVDAIIVFTDPLQRQLHVTVKGTLQESGQPFALVFFVTADGVELQESINKHG